MITCLDNVDMFSCIALIGKILKKRNIEEKETVSTFHLIAVSQDHFSFSIS